MGADSTESPVALSTEFSGLCLALLGSGRMAAHGVLGAVAFLSRNFSRTLGAVIYFNSPERLIRSPSPASTAGIVDSTGDSRNTAAPARATVRCHAGILVILIEVLRAESARAQAELSCQMGFLHRNSRYSSAVKEATALSSSSTFVIRNTSKLIASRDPEALDIMTSGKIG